MISTEGAVTVDGDLNSEKGGVAIHAANNIEAQKIRSFDGVVALSSYNGEIIVEDDINTVRGGVTIAAKEGVEVARITTGVGEVNIGSGKSIVVSGNISTNVGYVNLKAGGSLSTSSITTNDGYISLGADSNVEVSGLATGSGVINLISATGSVAAVSIDTDGSYVAIEAALEIIASAIEANGGGVNLVANSDFGGIGLIASGGVTDVGIDAIDSLNELIISQQEFIAEVVSDLIYHRRDIGEFVIGVLYQTVANNLEDAFNIGQFILPYKLPERDKRNWTRIIESQSTAFQLGRELANAASIVQGIIELFTGGAAVVSASSLCLAGAGATLGASCLAAAPAIASGAALSAHGLSLIKNGIENDTDANLIDDLLAPQNMASTGGADGIRGLSRETGISQESIKKVYGDVSSEEIKLLGDKLNKNLAEPLFNQGNKDYIRNVTDSVKLIGDDLDAIDGIETTLRNNKIPEEFKVEAFSELVGFLKKYKNKVSGEFAFRFGKANVPETAPLEIAKQTRGARGEIDSAIDILEGNTVLGNPKSLKAIPEKKLPDGSTTPDFLITGIDNSIRLGEIKTPKGNISANNIKKQIRDATRSIRKSSETVTDKGFISIDYGQVSPTDWKRERIFNEIKRGLLQTDANSGLKGTDVVEFVEFTYKELNSNSLQKMLVKVENGIIKIIN